MSKARIGIDVGGTFTDTFLELEDGRSLFDKRLTTLESPDEAILGAVQDLARRAGVVPADVALIVHGTTLATNALIERRGARTGLITTDGFRDVLEMGREDRYSQYDLNLVKPSPLVPRRLRFTVRERIASDGAVLLRLDDEGLGEVARRLSVSAVESVAICFINSYVNPAHEQEARDRLHALLPDLPLSLSSEVAPVIREFERFTTTAANAYVQPIVGTYLGRLAARLDVAGFTCPRLLMLSGGTLCDFATGGTCPVRLIESGPAGGATFAAQLAARHGIAHAMAFDLGGTTAKMTLIDSGAPHLTSTFEAARMERFLKGSGLPLKVPSIDLLEIGAGGGSVAWADGLGRLRVGPEGTGSTPGPACYGRGGTRPTVTDANLILGRVSRESFSGGVSLLPELAEAAVATLEAGGGTGAAGPAAILAAVDEAMALAARLHAVEKGADPAGRELIAFGGGGPLHAASVAEAIGIRTVLVPPDAGIGSAIGFLRAEVAFEMTRSALYVLGRAGANGAVELAAMEDRMAGDAKAVVSAATDGRAVAVSWRAAIRYVGQGHELQIVIPSPTAPAAVLRDAFEAEYRRLYGRRLERIGVEVVSWTCRAGLPGTPVTLSGPVVARPARDKARGREPVGGARHGIVPHDLYERDDLRPGDGLDGPCLVREVATTTAVPPGWSASVLSDGTLKLSRKEHRRDA